MSRLKERMAATSPNAQTVGMSPVPPHKARSRVRVIVLVLVFLIDALVALPLGWVAEKNHLAGGVVSLFTSSWPQTASRTQPRLPLPARGSTSTLTPTPTPSPSPSPSPFPSEVSEDTFQRPNQLFWGTASGGGSWLADASTSPAFAIADRVGQVTASSGTFTALLGPRLTNAELMVTLSISRFNGENNMGAVLHWRDTTHWYKVYLNGESLVLIKRDASQTLQLGSVPFPAQPGLRYSLLVQVRGTVFLAKAWPASSSEPASWELRVADQSATWFSGYGGLRMYYLSRGSVTTTVAFFRETRTL